MPAGRGGSRTVLRTALVTGASSGIGRAVAERLLHEGVRVVGVARRSAALPEHESMAPEPLDLARLDALELALPELARRHPEIDALVLCAGRGRFGSLEELSYRQIRELVDLNFTGQALVCRAFLPALKRRARSGAGSAHVVLLGSEAALRGRHGGTIYCATKFALRGFAQALREEGAASGVRVTLVNPGMVRSAFFDELDFEPGESEDNYLVPEDVADAVWLALSARPSTVLDEIDLSPLKRVVKKKPQRRPASAKTDAKIDREA